MNYPNPHDPRAYRPPPASSGSNTILIIVLVVLGVVVVLGGGSCLVCVALVGSAADETQDAAISVTTATPTATVAVPPTPTATATPVATATATVPRTPVASKPRVVDFACPPGKKPGGAVRSGCLCGSEILGSACGAPGNFLDVTETPTGCRFICN